MQSLLSLGVGKPKSSAAKSLSGPSPLESFGAFRAQQAETALRQLSRSEWWLWFSALVVTALSAVVLALSFFQSLFLRHDHIYEISSAQARWSVFCLLLLFNSWLLYRQWSFRRERKRFAVNTTPAETNAEPISGASALDPLTGLFTRSFIEQQLGKEIARARRENTSLTVATLHLDDFADLSKRHGPSATDLALKELARRLKKACRGSDYAVRLTNDEFLLVLPECSIGEVKTVLNRIGSVQVLSSGHTVTLPYTTGWIDYQPGDMPSDLLKRAREMMHLFEGATRDPLSRLAAR
jgi:diguanylate cyclase (GGDEF)-like protein